VISAGYLTGRMDVPVQQHQILIRATSKGCVRCYDSAFPEFCGVFNLHSE
jgi:hypothetical protein